ncbi:MAG TPA: hypothetical protein VHZ52_03425 [Acidobacteriaceae bacterium]|nr:hypothetical protein [Acidobacteriaceae bacterium]
MINDLREAFNASYRPESYQLLMERLNAVAGTAIEFRVAETPAFLPQAMLEEMAAAGERLTNRLLAWPEYLTGARGSIPDGFLVAGQADGDHPHFLTADFALIRDSAGELAPRLVEIQAFPSVYAYQAALSDAYREIFGLPDSLGVFLGGLDAERFWHIFRETILGKYAPENVALTEVDPEHQKTLPDFLLTAKRLGIAVVDIAKLVPIGRKLHYRNGAGELVPIHRIYNRAIADEIVAKQIQLPFDLTAPWDVEWAGHPNWYFLISKYAVPWLSSAGEEVVPPAAFLDDFLSGPGFTRLEAAGVALPGGGDAVYEDLLLKPLFSFAGKGIQFGPSRAELEAIPEEERGNYLVQQRMHFVPTIQTPHGLTQAEIRILYLWPDGGRLTPALALVRLGRGKMMGVDHNRNQEWVGASAAFWR